MSTNRTTKTRSSRRPEPYPAPPWAQPSEARAAAGAGPGGEKLVKVNSAQINTIRQRYQATAKKSGARRQRKPGAAARPTSTAATKPMRAGALRAAELEFRKLAIELGMERARAVVAEVERGR